MPEVAQNLTIVDRTYGEALLNLADGADALDEIRDEVDQLQSLIKANEGLRRLIDSYRLSVAQRAEALERIFKGQVHDVTYRFIQVVNAKDRLPMLPGILRGYVAAYEQRKGIVDVEAWTAAELDEDVARDITGRLSEILGGEVRLRRGVDADLIGGLKLRVGDQMIDGSVQAQLRVLRKRIVEAGRQRRQDDLNQLFVDADQAGH